MTDKHTPGPWKVDGESVREVDTDDVIAQPGDNFSAVNPSQTLVANAKLIAAAPALLEALEDAKRVIGNLIASIEQHHATGNCYDSDIWALANREYRALDEARDAIKLAKGDA